MKINCLRFFMHILMVSILTTPLLAQSYAHVENEGTPGFSSNSDCEFTVNIKVRVANLEKITNSDINGVFSLPEHYPSLYLQYQMADGNISGNFTVTDFRYDDDFTNKFNNGIKYYTASYSVDQLDFTPQCNQEQNDEMTVPYIITFQTFSGTSYPICQYTLLDDIFAYDAFPFASTYSSSKKTMNVSCQDINLNILYGNIYFNCSACNQSASSNIGIQYLQTSKSELVITPNPFDQEIRLQGWAENPITSITLFNATGKLLKFITFSEELSDGWVIQTTQLPSGIYFVQVKSKIDKKTFKLIK